MIDILAQIEGADIEALQALELEALEDQLRSVVTAMARGERDG